MITKLILASCLSMIMTAFSINRVWAKDADVPVCDEKEIDSQLLDQAKLIQQGVRRGALTFEESESLSKEQVEILKAKQALKLDDNKLSEDDIHKLLLLLNRSERNIVREMTNDDRRWKRD